MSRWPDQPSTSVAPGAGARRWPTEGAALPSASGPLLAGLGASRPAAAARPSPQALHPAPAAQGGLSPDAVCGRDLPPPQPGRLGPVTQPWAVLCAFFVYYT